MLQGNNTNWINELENKVSRTLFDAQDVAGSVTNRVKQTVLSFKVSLFIQSWKQRKSVF